MTNREPTLHKDKIPITKKEITKNHNDIYFKYTISVSILFLFICELIITYYLLGIVNNDSNNEQNHIILDEHLFEQLLLNSLHHENVKKILDNFIIHVLLKSDHSSQFNKNLLYDNVRKKRYAIYKNHLETTNNQHHHHAATLHHHLTKGISSIVQDAPDLEIPRESDNPNNNDWFWLSGTSRVPVSVFYLSVILKTESFFKY